MGVTLAVGTVKGAFVFRSDDRARWEMEGPLFPGWKVTAFEPLDGELLVATASFVYGPAIQRSTDLSSWEQLVKGPAYPEGGERRLTEIWRMRSTSDRLYAGVEEAGLFASDDGGDSWQDFSGLNDHPTRDVWFPGFGGLCAHAILADGDRVWCGISAVGVFRSDDGGETWKPRNEGVTVTVEEQARLGIGYCVHGLAAHPNDPDLIFRQDHRGVYRTDDGGDRWEQIERGLPSGFGFPVVVDRSGSVYVVPLTSDEFRYPPDGRLRVFRSEDRGESWQVAGELGRDLYASVLRGSMDVDGLEPPGVYVGTATGDVFASPDRGETWTRLPGSLPRILSVAVLSS